MKCTHCGADGATEQHLRFTGDRRAKMTLDLCQDCFTTLLSDADIEAASPTIA